MRKSLPNTMTSLKINFFLIGILQVNVRVVKRKTHASPWLGAMLVHSFPMLVWFGVSLILNYYWHA